MNIEILHVTFPYTFKSPFAGKEFTVLTYVHDTNVTREDQNKICDEIVAQGCRYAICAGHECTKWDDSFDRSHLEINGYDYSDDEFVMTTWHENESVEDIVFFAFNCANFDEYKTKNLCIVHIGENKDIENQFEIEIEKQIKENMSDMNDNPYQTPQSNIKDTTPKEEKIDKGFCLSYWKLSYRRKFLRTLWMMPSNFFIYFLDIDNLYGLSIHIFVALAFLASGFQAIYNYKKWQKEKAETLIT